MARTVKDTQLDKRSARERLKKRHEPYWRAIDSGMHIGYRKGKIKSSWHARFLKSDGGYSKTTLGIADDIQDSDGGATLNFSEAQSEARAWFAIQAQKEKGVGISENYTVSDALDDYLEEYESRGGKSLYDNKNRSNRLIRPRLGDQKVAELTTRGIRQWHRHLATERPLARSKKHSDEINYRDTSNDPDADRKRRHTANKILTILKAALNLAWQEGTVASDEAWRRVKPFKGVDAPRIRYLTISECKRLLNSSEPSFRQIVQAAIYSGCRYGELSQLLAKDLNLDSGTIHIRESKSGKDRHVVITEEGQRFFERLAAGKSSGDHLLVRSDGVAWGKSHQTRPLIEACKNANIEPAITFHILRHTYASNLIMNGVPLGVVAKNLGHADTRTTERHYAHLSDTYVANAIRDGSHNMGLYDADNVEPMQG